MGLFVFMISEKAVKEFQKIYEEKFGKKIDNRTALDLGINLLTILDKTYRPIKKEWAKEFESKNDKNNTS